MAITWTSLVHRSQVRAQLLGEVALTVVLAVTLAYSSRDGLPIDEYADAIGPADLGAASTQVVGDNPVGHPFHPSRAPIVAPTPPPLPPVPTAAPVMLLIPTLDVHRPVEKVGVDHSGVLDLPVNAWNAGWYKGGPVPGAPGDAVIEGHAGFPGKPMIFGKLTALQPGDRIVVVLADGSHRLFIVTSMASIPVGAAPPGLATSKGPPRLTLITCTGSFDKGTYSYAQRLVLQARYAGIV